MIWRMIPGLNFFYDLFFNKVPPSPDSVKNLFDVLGLINALLLASPLGMACAFDFAEFSVIDARFSEETSENALYWKYWKDSGLDVPPSSVFYRLCITGLALLMVGIIVVVWVYTDMLAKLPKQTTEGPNWDRQIRTFSLWWFYAKLSAVFLMMTTAIAAIYAILVNRI